MEMVKMHGALTVEKNVLEYVKKCLNESLVNFAVVAERDSLKEDILATNPQMPPLLADFCEEKMTHSTFVFELDVPRDRAESIADILIDPIVEVLSGEGFFGSLF